MKAAAAIKSIWISAITAMVLSTTGFTQSISDLLFDDVSQYLGAATRLIAAAIGGVDRLEASQLPPGKRLLLRNELRDISYQLSSITARQHTLIEEIERRSFRRKNFILNDILQAQTSGYGGFWGPPEVKDISDSVSVALKSIENSEALKMVFDAKDRLALRETLLGRQTLLDKLATLPMPNTNEDLEKLNQIALYYRKLVARLEELNVALTKAADRLASKRVND
jgi:hypothetical protein